MATTKKIKRTPDSNPMRKLERQVAKAEPVRQAALREAVRQAFKARRPRDKVECLPGAIHSLQCAEQALGGVDPEGALVYLSYASERISWLELMIARSVDQPGLRALEPVRQRARTPHGRAERVA